MNAAEKVQAILDTARREIGVEESPAGSNNVKYNTAYYGQTVHDGLWGTKFPWCCVFVWWVFQQAGLPGIFYAGGKTASCTTLWGDYKAKGQIVPIDQAQPGDVVFFNWTKGPKATVANHVGIVESRSGDTLTTIEGNTAVGNDGNGGAVMRRTRKRSVVCAVARPLYATVADEPDDWAEAAWAWAAQKGLLDGSRPHDSVTRQELAVVLHRLGGGT